MADRVFCIDFGSAYTKVALRRDPGADSELLTKRSRASSEADFCFHTTVAVDRRGPKAIPEFGERAAAMTPGGGVDVYRNWKKSIFLPNLSSAKSNHSPLEALLQSEELRDLANKFGVASSQLSNLQQLVGAAKNLIVGPTGRVYSTEVQQQTIAASASSTFETSSPPTSLISRRGGHSRSSTVQRNTRSALDDGRGTSSFLV